jgi:predicted transcriptional regulator
MCYIASWRQYPEPSMSTTTIRLPEELKARVAQAAEAAGTTSHNFILEAIAEKAALAEQRAEFHALADQRYAQFLESGESIPWEEARTYLMQRMAGKPAKRPLARKQAR